MTRPLPLDARRRDPEVEALEQERERHLAALDALDVGLLVVDRDLRVLLANESARRAYNGRPERFAEAGGVGDWEVLRADGTEWPEDERPLIRAARTGQGTDATLLLLRKGAISRWLEVSARPLRRPGSDAPYAALGTFTDVTERVRHESTLRESETHFRLLAENSTDVISRHAADGSLLYVSPGLTQMLGWEPLEIAQAGPLEGVHPDDRELLLQNRRHMLSTGETTTTRYRRRHRDGHWIWMESIARPVRGADGRLSEFQASSRDVSRQVEAEQRLARLALADPLTGLANRAALTQHLEDRLDEPGLLALLFLDLDRFKVVNDSLGHSAGDELLRTIAARLAGTVRDGDLVARLGGDEFVVVASGIDQEAAVALSERVQAVVRSPIRVAGNELVISASVGIVVADTDGFPDAEALLRDADTSMYRAKATGRARSVVWSEALGEAARARLAVEHDLRRALDEEALSVYYQPQVCLTTGRIAGVEALVRWDHPQRGLLPPGEFLAVADDTGLVVELGRQVVRTAAAQVAAWRRLPGCEDLKLSVNLSAQELLSPDRTEDTAEVLEVTGLPPEALTVEVLESVLLDPEGAVMAALAGYTDLGVQLALDDFGTGSSSLLHLRRVPVSVVKIDRAFVSGLGHSRPDEAIVRAVRTLTDDLGLDCVAEGVEEEGQREWLRDAGVALAQGYLLARPLPAHECEALLRAASMQPNGAASAARPAVGE